jgi:hypothetical protein
MQILNLRSNSDTEEEGKFSVMEVPVTGEGWMQRNSVLRSGSRDIWDLSVFWYPQQRG